MSGREALLDAAFEELVARGPALPAEAVARRAGVSKALLFHHFGGGEGLRDAMAARVLAQTQEGLRRIVEDYPDPRERLAALARTLLEEPLDTSPAASRRVLLFWLAEDAEGGCRAALRDDLLAGFIAALVREGVALHAFRPGADGERAATVTLARWHGATVAYAAGRRVDFEAEADALVRELEALTGRAVPSTT